MDGLEHGVPLAYVGRSGSSYASLELGSLVREDVSVEVGQDHDLELGAGGVGTAAGD